MSYNLKLREIRKAKGLTQLQLAELVGETDRVIGSWERQETSLPADSAIALCCALGCTPNDLCGWYDTHPKDSSDLRLDEEESEIICNYRQSTPQWRQNIAMTARAAAGESKEAAKSSVSATEERMAV